jgi:hypothetical protein
VFVVVEIKKCNPIVDEGTRLKFLMSKMVGVDEKKKNLMFQQYDDGGVTVAFHGREVYEGVPLSHFSKKSPLNVVFYTLLVFNKMCQSLLYFIVFIVCFEL